MQTLIEQAAWLNISFGAEDVVPFRVYANGQELTGLYSVYDAEMLQKLDFTRPSGLEPQAYLFQNAQFGKRYLVTLQFPGAGEDVLYFGAVLPEK